MKIWFTFLLFYMLYQPISLFHHFNNMISFYFNISIKINIIGYSKILAQNKPLPNEQIDKLKEILYQDGFSNKSDNDNNTLIITRAKLYQLLEENTKDEEIKDEVKTKAKIPTILNRFAE